MTPRVPRLRYRPVMRGDLAECFELLSSGDEEGKRGPEKRRQVLAYVRQRPEELRPWNA